MTERDKALLGQAGVGDNWNTADWYSMSPKMIEKFADLVRADEREACAKVCREEAPSLDGQLCAEAIRARGNT
ncbi:hypothetical protein UFOVP48_30 [uncultured Caudovirales phage]|uniref:Uncharacterized protein n=1 Tax=uncultured Caudovirales phage TaxID=2100421 RepID=A0A6J5KRA6_9CAUD|nr:hypothetical protein UFOVP48_30 [uncultured Caudovirales phage]